MADLPADHLGPPRPDHRRFEARRRVRVGDVDRHGCLRLDALAGYLQDVAGDDSADAGLRGVSGWVVRRNVVEVVRPPSFDQDLVVTTWASGAGSRWAERRISIRPADGEVSEGWARPGEGWVEGVSLWVHVDPASLRPTALDPRFVEVYEPATGGRRVSSRLQHPTGPDPARPIERWPWVVRATDLDLFHHVNNAATWAVVEEARARRPWPVPYRAELEYRVPIPPEAQVVVEVQAGSGDAGSGAIDLWLRDADAGTLFATVQVRPRPG